jgi:hypothetical protein
MSRGTQRLANGVKELAEKSKPAFNYSWKTIEPMMWTLIILCVVFPGLLLGQIYALGLKMSAPEKMMQPFPDGLNALTPLQRQTIEEHQEWLNSENLQFRACFRFGAITVATFQQGAQPRFFSFMFHQRTTFSAETYWQNLTLLDTSSSGSLGLFPRPGSYAQSFPGISAEGTWGRHLEGEAYLAEKFKFPAAQITRPYVDLVVSAMRIRMQHNRSQSFWPFRVLYRYFVTRNQIANRTVMQQLP